MTDGAQLRLVEEAVGSETSEDGQKVFARSFAVPPGAPWDQTRAAALEARASAPLPLGDLVYQVRRFDSWRPGRAAKFVAFYARTTDVAERLKTEMLVDGQSMQVVFVSSAARDREMRRGLVVATFAATSVVLIALSVAVSIASRSEADQQLASLEQLADAKSRLARTVDIQRRAAAALDRAGMRRRSLDDYLHDLDWASSAKAPGARIQAVHWDSGALAVESRGDTAPFVAAGREATKVDKPLKPGVWLWGVTDPARNPLPQLDTNPRPQSLDANPTAGP